MNTQTILVRAIEVVTFIFAAFGGFLTNIAPPEEADSKFAVGISSLLALVILLFISGLSKHQSRRKYKRTWLATSSVLLVIGVFSVFLYKWNLDRLTFSFPPESTRTKYMAGTELSPDAQEWQRKTGDNDAQTVDNFGGLEGINRVWTPGSIRRAKMILITNYVVLILSLASAIFCLTEGVLVEAKPRLSTSERNSGTS